MQKTWVWSLGWGDPLEKEMAPLFSILTWEIPWTEELGRPQSLGSQRVGHDWAISLSLEPLKIKSATVSIVLPSICHEVMESDAMIFIFRMLSVKPAFSLSFFTFIKRLFSYSSLSAIRVVSSAYLRLLIFLLAILISAVLHPAWHSSWCTLHIS